MNSLNEIAVRVDNKGRVTLPKKMREALGLKVGDTVFLKCEAENNQLLLAPAVSPFDILAGHAIKEYKEGSTVTIEEYAKKQGIGLNE